MLEIKKEIENDEAIFYLTGHLDALTNESLKIELDQIHDSNITLDFRNIDYLTSTGLLVILSTYKRLQAAGDEMKILNVNEKVYQIFSMIGFEDLFIIKKLHV
ncbi:STAS domain-containing protein [bacterium]|nr:STAS domain-containing protein [bacterium]